MKWFKVDKSKSRKPKSGTWEKWKTFLAIECNNQCVYCAISDAHFGGLWAFHVEHYKPKSTYAKLENDIRNLFYACAVCNVFKGDEWRANPKDDHSVEAFPNPSKHDFNDLFAIKNGVLEGKYRASKYVIERLYLNRPHLIRERRIYVLQRRLEEIDKYIAMFKGRVKEIRNLELKNLAIDILASVSDLWRDFVNFRDLSPYFQEEMKRKRARKKK